MAVILQKPVEMQVWYKNPLSGEWVIRVVRAKKHDSDITGIITGIWTEMDKDSEIRANVPITIIQPNWAETGEDVELLRYEPYEHIWVNWRHVERKAKKSDKG